VKFLYFSYGVNVPLRTSFYSMEWVINSRLTAFCQHHKLYNLESYRRQLWCFSSLAHCTQFNSKSQWSLSWRRVLFISLIFAPVIFILISMTSTVRLLDTWMHVQLCVVFSYADRDLLMSRGSVICDTVLIKAHNSHKYNFGLINYIYYYVWTLLHTTHKTL
jgi:hypothetical protein